MLGKPYISYVIPTCRLSMFSNGIHEINNARLLLVQLRLKVSSCNKAGGTCVRAFGGAPGPALVVSRTVGALASVICLPLVDK